MHYAISIFFIGLLLCFIYQLLVTLHYQKEVRYLTVQVFRKPNHDKCDKCSNMAQYHGVIFKNKFRCWDHHYCLFKYY